MELHLPLDDVMAASLATQLAPEITDQVQQGAPSDVNLWLAITGALAHHTGAVGPVEELLAAGGQAAVAAALSAVPPDAADPLDSFVAALLDQWGGDVSLRQRHALAGIRSGLC